MGSAGAPGATEFRLLAEHLGGVALRDYHSAMVEIGQEPPTLPGGVASTYEAAKAGAKL